MKRADIVGLLPDIYQISWQPDDGNALDGLLHVMEDLHAPVEETLAQLERYLNAYDSPDRFLTFLAGWFYLRGIALMQQRIYGETSGWAVEQGLLRHLIAEAMSLIRWRGTCCGLIRLVSVATGLNGYSLCEAVPTGDGGVQPFFIQLFIPEDARRPEHRAMIQYIIRTQKPAHLRCEIVANDPPSRLVLCRGECPGRAVSPA